MNVANMLSSRQTAMMSPSRGGLGILRKRSANDVISFGPKAVRHAFELPGLTQLLTW